MLKGLNTIILSVKFLFNYKVACSSEKESKRKELMVILCRNFWSYSNFSELSFDRLLIIHQMGFSSHSPGKDLTSHHLLVEKFCFVFLKGLLFRFNESMGFTGQIGPVQIFQGVL